MTGYATGQLDTQSDDRLCINRMATCALTRCHILLSTCYTPDGCFEEYLFAAFPKDSKRTRSAVIHQQFGERIIHFLKNPLSIKDRNFRHLIKRSGFQLLDLPEAGIRGCIGCPSQGGKGGNSFWVSIHFSVVDYWPVCWYIER